jgi:hypothetical protein
MINYRRILVNDRLMVPVSAKSQAVFNGWRRIHSRNVSFEKRFLLLIGGYLLRLTRQFPLSLMIEFLIPALRLSRLLPELVGATCHLFFGGFFARFLDRLFHFHRLSNSDAVLVRHGTKSRAGDARGLIINSRL